MIHFLNRRELATVSSLEQCNTIEKALGQCGIPYHTKVVDRASPSVFSAGTRERSGTLFQNMAYNWIYTVYVKRSDYETALDCTGLRPIR